MGADNAPSGHSLLGALLRVSHGLAEHARTREKTIAPSDRIGLEDDPFRRRHNDVLTLVRVTSAFPARHRLIALPRAVRNPRRTRQHRSAQIRPLGVYGV